MTVPVGGESALTRLLYMSHSRIPRTDRPTVLAQIFSYARSHNKAAAISGALLITDHYFAQVLEGPPGAVEELYGRISDDPRHEQLTVLETATSTQRVFPGWAMAQVSTAGHADIPLHANRGVIQPKAPGHLTHEQSQLFTQMRHAIGADSI
jgi:hypothetical protein